MRLNHKEIKKNKDMRRKHNGFDIDEDEIIDDMDSSAEASRQVALIDQRTEDREKRNRERERKQCKDNKREAVRGTGNTDTLVPRLMRIRRERQLEEQGTP